MTSRRGPMRRGSTAASPRARVGWIRAARRAVSHAASVAVAIPAPMATSSGSGLRRRTKLSGISPCATSRPRSQPASATAGTAPAMPAARATTCASQQSIQRTWRGVAATARSSATSRLRCCTENASVLATTNSATISAIPPNDPASSTSSALASARSRNSTAPRSAPVLTCAPVPSRAAAIRWRRVSVGTPGSATTPMASTRSGLADSRWASAVVKNSADWRASPSRPGVDAIPLTR